MIFRTYGPFEVELRDRGDVDPDQRRLWNEADSTREGLADACGCYVFGVRSGGGQRPWYVGQANKQGFCREVFTPAKLNHYTGVALDYERGTPVLYLIARVTPADQLSRPSEVGHDDIDALENILIGQALRRNPHLWNKKDTKALREIKVYGVMNCDAGHPGNSAIELRAMMGIEESL